MSGAQLLVQPRRTAQLLLVLRSLAVLLGQLALALLQSRRLRVVGVFALGLQDGYLLGVAVALQQDRQELEYHSHDLVLCLSLGLGQLLISQHYHVQLRDDSVRDITARHLLKQGADFLL